MEYIYIYTYTIDNRHVCNTENKSVIHLYVKMSLYKTFKE